jgi:hypothetical protein
MPQVVSVLVVLDKLPLAWYVRRLGPQMIKTICYIQLEEIYWATLEVCVDDRP